MDPPVDKKDEVDIPMNPPHMDLHKLKRGGGLKKKIQTVN
jgi:hypothetical protein